MFKYHCKNLKQIEKAISLIERELRNYISTEQDEQTYIYTKILSHLITCWIEVRVLKLTYETKINCLKIFTDNEIDQILKAPTLSDRWKTALNIAICKGYKIKASNNIKSIKKKLGPTVKYRYNEILEIIDNDILSSAQIRNRVAHGQWLYAFTNDLSNVSKPLTETLNIENIIKLQMRKKFLSIFLK